MQPLSFSSRHVGVAAEAFAAALFARCGLDISVQYGANQPEYDLIVALGDRILKVSVKGSKDGGWGLTQSLLREANYHGAVDSWLARHKPRTIFCLVQFKGVAEDAMPRVYLATPAEIAERLRASAAGRGDTILYERHVWGPRAAGRGSVEEIPESWRFSSERVARLLESNG
jgi:Holliday junction resolvase-like predicted endonuclease